MFQCPNRLNVATCKILSDSLIISVLNHSIVSLYEACAALNKLETYIPAVIFAFEPDGIGCIP